jgi:PD-(D/E)XK nuclease superfamily
VTGIQVLGVAADRNGPRFSEALAIWPELQNAPALMNGPYEPTRTRIVSTHRSLASESVVQVLLEARRNGVAWQDMAVVVRNRGSSSTNERTGSEMLGALGRSGRRAGIRFTEPGRQSSADPLVRHWLRIVDGKLADRELAAGSSAPDSLASEGVSGFVARDSDAGRATTGVLRDLLFRVWESEIARLALAAGQATIAACNAVFRVVRSLPISDTAGCRAELRRIFANSWVNGDSAEGLVATSSTVAPVVDSSQVAVLTPLELAGRQFAVMVIVGLAEGSWPTTFSAQRHPGDTGSTDVQELRAALAHHVASEETLFLRCVARATNSVVAVAAPEPGVLLSRLIEDWPTHTYAYLPMRRAKPLPNLTETPGVVPCFPDGRLRLSASQLSTFENCPQNFAYQYVAAVRGSGSVQASVGTMVHEALERYLTAPTESSGAGPETDFETVAGIAAEQAKSRLGDRTETKPLTPYAPVECGLPALMACLDDVWDSTAFAYRPQEADYRRRAEDWLRTWWENELPKIAQVVAVEHRFSITVGDDGEHVLVGSIDRVSIDPNGNLEIVDYKTGTPPGGSIDEEDLQLATYHLAVNNDPAFAGVGQPDRLRLHFLQNSKDIDQPIQVNHAELTSARIAFRANEILTEVFRPSIDADCQYCAFQRACPIQPLGTEVGA